MKLLNKVDETPDDDIEDKLKKFDEDDEEADDYRFVFRSLLMETDKRVGDPDIFLMGHPRPLFLLFMVFFKHILQQINVKKYPQHMVQGFELTTLRCESPLITTRPGLPTLFVY